jgi:hypothetical protein
MPFKIIDFAAGNGVLNGEGEAAAFRAAIVTCIEEHVAVGLKSISARPERPLNFAFAAAGVMGNAIAGWGFMGRAYYLAGN